MLPRQHKYRNDDNNGDIHPITPQQETNGFLSIKFSGNIAVIRTKPSYAGTLAYNIDNCDFPEIIGTIAGDDTVMLIIAEDTTKGAVLKILRNIIPNI